MRNRNSQEIIFEYKITIPVGIIIRKQYEKFINILELYHFLYFNYKHSESEIYGEQRDQEGGRNRRIKQLFHKTAVSGRVSDSFQVIMMI